MAIEEFESYAGALPSATLPLDPADQVLVVQGGLVKTVSMVDAIAAYIAANFVAPDAIFQSASATDVTVDLVGKTEVYIWKTDSSSNRVYFTDSGGNTVALGDTLFLGVQGQGIHLKLNGTNWYVGSMFFCPKPSIHHLRSR